VPRTLYLINPREDGPSYHSMEVLRAWQAAPMTGIADLTTPTVAAFAPANWDVTICDERVQSVNLDTPAQFVGITGKVTQRDRTIELAVEFKKRGKTVVIGGPYATLNPEDVRPFADILVLGEIEEIAPGMFADIEKGCWKASYVGTKPDLRLTPIPRWDLYPREIALSAQIQTSRGCPFECEFCDVIQYLGRKQRWKEPEQVVQELDVLYARGYRSVFFADDNFTVMRRRARALLERVAAWNKVQRAGHVALATQVSIDIARDPELLQLCVAAGFNTVFIGVETPNEDSLAETLKRQNLRIDLADEVRKVVRPGLMVMSGMIVGFDHDGPDIFERQASFINSLPVPAVTLGLLVAPIATPLHARLQKEGRLIAHARLGGGGILETNIQPKLMDLPHLQAGMKWLLNYIYSPAAFAKRVQNFADVCELERKAERRPFFVNLLLPLARQLAGRGEPERRLLRFLEQLSFKRPELRAHLRIMLFYYCQARYMLEYYKAWQPALGRASAPAWRRRDFSPATGRHSALPPAAERRL
jgi:radical SAM superfamily enzyme YgiQ (UPF0313 family)